MNKLKYNKPMLHAYLFSLEDSLSVSSATFTTGGEGAIPQMEEWQDDLNQVDWEFQPPET